MSTGSELAALPLSGYGRALAFAPDGWTLAVGDSSGGVGTLSLREPGGYRLVTTSCRAATLSADGTRLALATQGRAGDPPAPSLFEVRIVDAATGIEQLALRGHRLPISALAFDAEARRVISGSWDGMIRLWDARTGEPLPCVAAHKSRHHVLALAFSPDGRLFASAGGDPDLHSTRADFHLWDAVTGQQVRSLEAAPSTGQGHTVAFSPDGQFLLGAASDSLDRGGASGVHLWEVATGNLVRTIPTDLPVPIRGAAFAPDGKQVAICAGGSGPGRILLVATNGTGSVLVLRTRQGVQRVAFHPDGRQIVSGGGDGNLRFWDIATGTELLALEAHPRPILALGFDAAGRRLVSAGAEGTVRVWDPGAEGGTHRMLGFSFPPTAVAFSPDSSLLATAGGSLVERTNIGEVRLWETATGRERHSLSFPEGAAPVVAFHPDGQTVVAGGRAGVVRAWDVRTGQEMGILARVQLPIQKLAFSPDGRRLAVIYSASVNNCRVLICASAATPSMDGATVTLRDPILGNPPVAFSADGRLLLVGKSRQAWDATTGAPVDLPDPADVPVRSKGEAISPNGRWLAWCGGGTVRILPAPAASPVANAVRDRAELLAWHTDRAEEALAGKAWYAARFHLDRLLAEEPAVSALHVQRARVWAALGRVDLALADLAHPSLATSRDPDVLVANARALLASGDAAGYAAVRTALLRAGPPDENALAIRVGWACAVGATGEGEQLLAVAEEACRRGQGAEATRTLAALLLRANRLAEAAEVLTKGRPASAGGEQPVEELLLAITHARLGRPVEARRTLDLATGWFDRRTLPTLVGGLAAGSMDPLLGLAALAGPLPEAPLPGDRTPTLAELRRLRAEAEGLLGR